MFINTEFDNTSEEKFMSVYYGFSDSVNEFPQTVGDICFASLSSDGHRGKGRKYFDMVLPTFFFDDTGVTKEQVANILRGINSHPLLSQSVVDIPGLDKGLEESHAKQYRYHLIKLNNKHNVHQVIAIAAVVRNILERPGYFLRSFEILCNLGVPPHKSIFLAQDVEFLEKRNRVSFPMIGNHRVGRPLFWEPSHIYSFFNSAFRMDKGGFAWNSVINSMYEGKGYHSDISSYVDGEGRVPSGILHYLFYKEEDDKEKRHTPKFLGKKRYSSDFSGSPEGRSYSIETFETHIKKFGWVE